MKKNFSSLPATMAATPFLTSSHPHYVHSRDYLTRFKLEFYVNSNGCYLSKAYPPSVPSKNISLKVSSFNIFSNFRVFHSREFLSNVIKHDSFIGYGDVKKGLLTVRGEEIKYCEVEEEDVSHVLKIISDKIKADESNINLIENITALLRLGASYQQTAKMFIKCNSLIQLDAETQIYPKFKLFFKYGVSQKDVITVMSTSTIIFNRSDDRMEDVLQFLVQELGMIRLGKVICGCPSVLGISLDKLKEKHDALKEVGFENVGNAFVRFPSLFTYKSSQIYLKVENLIEIMGREDTVYVLNVLPQLLGSNLLTIKEGFEWFVSHFGKEDSLKMIRKSPGILQKRSETIQNKYNFVKNIMHRDPREIMKHPSVFVYSLKNRIIPRYEALCRLGIENKYSLSYMFGTSNLDFENMILKKSNLDLI